MPPSTPIACMPPRLFFISFSDLNLLTCVSYQQYLCMASVCALLCHSDHSDKSACLAVRDESGSIVDGLEAVEKPERGTHPILEGFQPDLDGEACGKWLDSSQCCNRR